jgi:hypothetical protein
MQDENFSVEFKQINNRKENIKLFEFSLGVEIVFYPHF